MIQASATHVSSPARLHLQFSPFRCAQTWIGASAERWNRGHLVTCTQNPTEKDPQKISQLVTHDLENIWQNMTKIHSSLQLSLSLSTSLIAAFSFSIRWVYTFHQVVLWVIPDPDQLAHSYRKNGDPKKESVAKTDRHRETRNDLRLPSYLLAVTSIYPQENCKNTTQPVASQTYSPIFPQRSIHTSLLFQFPILCISYHFMILHDLTSIYPHFFIFLPGSPHPFQLATDVRVRRDAALLRRHRGGAQQWGSDRPLRIFSDPRRLGTWELPGGKCWEFHGIPIQFIFNSWWIMMVQISIDWNGSGMMNSI